MLRDFLVNEVIGGPNGVDNPAISGINVDDFWNWKGQSEPSQSSLAKTLGITKIKGPVPGPMGGYARVLGEKITALESSMTD